MSSELNKLPEPFGYFRATPFGWEDCAQGDDGAQALYDEDAISTQAARIAELEARIHTCGPTCSKAGCINRRVTAERDQLRAEVERLRADALRYHAFFASGLSVCFEGVEHYTKADCDAAIDAALTHNETP